MNPNTCTICEMMFERVMKARQVEIDATILFADLRGYTSLSRSQSSEAIRSSSTPSTTNAPRRSGTGKENVNKTIGDSVMAVFNFPIVQDDHAAQAVRAAKAIQERWRARRETLSSALGG